MAEREPLRDPNLREVTFEGHSLFGEEGHKIADTILALERGDITVEEAGAGFSKQGDTFGITLDRESLQVLAGQIRGGDFDEARRIRNIKPVKGPVGDRLTNLALGLITLEEAGDGFFRTRNGILGIKRGGQASDTVGRSPNPTPAPKKK